MADATRKPKVLITGCSEGALGAALSIAFHKAGYHVYATVRDPAKMKGLESQGIETLVMDSLSDESIATCVQKVPSLDMLVNNAGRTYVMPVVDVNIAAAKEVYDLNAFLPLLLKSKGTVVNQTSVSANLILPFQAAALAMMSDTLRLELEPLGVKVVDLRTGVVKTNLIKNMQEFGSAALPEGSVYEPAREALEGVPRQEKSQESGVPRQQWADAMVKELSRKSHNKFLWSAETSFVCRFLSLLPHRWADGLIKQATSLDSIARILGKHQRNRCVL
ncbi:unnamed protein product [Clonostachys byssicola]|uniref:Uncharacterized protein n=1 Tax=Clonostachys byssicola TaxID=160290 RepID=A0A9N9Y6A8_9HYPO|nr:unnamed protein product [Clonostachys byssicola]